MRSGWTTLWDFALSPTPAPTLPAWASQEQRESHSARVSDVSAPACTNGVMAPSAACECGAEEQTVDEVVLQCPIHRPPWSAWPDGSGWRDNRMAAQHLPRDLVRSSTGLKNWLKGLRRRQPYYYRWLISAAWLWNPKPVYEIILTECLKASKLNSRYYCQITDVKKDRAC